MSQESKNERWMTIQEYAAHRAVSRQRVDVFVRDVRFEGCVKHDSIGRTYVDQIGADAILAADEKYQRKKAKAVDAKAKAIQTVANKTSRAKTSGDSSSEQVFDNSAIELNHYKAKIAKQKFELEAGLLISIEKAQSQTYEMARAVRDSLLELPDRLSAWLAAQRDERKISIRLDEEIRIALERVIKIIEQAEENDLSITEAEEKAEEESLRELSGGLDA